MNKYLEVEEEFIDLSEKKIDIMPILIKYLSYWKWFLVSIILSIGVSAFYIYFTLPKYKITTSILFKDDQKGGTTDLNMMRDMGIVTRRNNANNEVEIMKKSLIAERVIKNLDLYVSYIEIDPLFSLDKILPVYPLRKKAVLYGDELPLKVVISQDDLNILSGDIAFEIIASPNGSSLFTGEFNNEEYSIEVKSSDTTVELPFGKFQLVKGKFQPKEVMRISVLVQPPLRVADGFLNSLEIELTSRFSSVADITLTAPHAQMGTDFLREYIKAYNEHGIKDQLELAEKTSAIIDVHLANLSTELSSVEDQAQQFRQSQGVTNIASQADLYNSQLASVSQRKMDMESQYTIVSSLLSFVQQKNGHDQLIPANSGVQSSILNAQITTYNDLVLERNRLSRIASSSNQSMIDLNNQLESTYHSVVSGLQNEKNNLDIQLKEINTEYSRNNAKIRAIPLQERALSDIKRQQNIKEDLFLYLLQKKEERYMNMTAVEANSKLVDNIRVAGVVWPKKMILLLLFSMIGGILPIIGIKIKDLLRYQIDNKADLESISQIPLLGEIPKSIHNECVVVKEDNNDSLNEMLRFLRANLLFVVDSKDKKVINILSSISGEGKSFISLNLAMSLALLDKKVLLIELDIRKPKLSEQLNLGSKEGITLYLSGYLDREDLIKPSGIHANLSVIPAGSVPPNPNELLSKPILDELIQELKGEYDFIIIDTAPIGLVSDGFLLNRIADVNLYVTRAGFTPKKYVEDADRYFRDKKLKKMYFILNSVNLNGSDYRYGPYKKYGYGY